MTTLGHDSTLHITLEEMIYHTKSVKRGIDAAQDECHTQYLKYFLDNPQAEPISPPPPAPMIITDMPFGSYGISVKESVNNCVKVLKESGADGVKLEGGTPEKVSLIKKIVDSGVPVLGHIGLIPQSFKVLGGYISQGKTAHDALSLINQAKELESAGVFALVIECVPAIVAETISKSITIPTIGIGAGVNCDGQVLVYNDLLGMSNNLPYFEYERSLGKEKETVEKDHLNLQASISTTPSFCKKYTNIGDEIQFSLLKYCKEVRDKKFPYPSHYSSYKMKPHEEEEFKQQISLIKDPSNSSINFDNESQFVEKLY